MHLRPLGHLSRPRHATYPLARTGLCGESGSRTHGTLADTPDFESGTFGHSVISPRRTLAASIGAVNVRGRSHGVVFARFAAVSETFPAGPWARWSGRAPLVEIAPATGSRAGPDRPRPRAAGHRS